MAGASWTGGTFNLSLGSVTNRHISNSAGDVIDTDKVQPYLSKGTNFALAIGGTPATREEIVYTCQGDGDIRGFHALCNDTGASSSMTFDLKKNGTTCLSSVITITNATTDKATQDGTLSVTTFTTGDILSISLTVSSATGAQGPYAWVTLTEDVVPAS